MNGLDRATARSMVKTRENSRYQISRCRDSRLLLYQILVSPLLFTSKIAFPGAIGIFTGHVIEIDA